MVVVNTLDMMLLYVLFDISYNCNNVIYHIIGTPRHGKNVVSGYNTCDKRYLIGNIFMIGTPEVDDSKSRMNVDSMVSTPSFSLAKECNRLWEKKWKIQWF